MHVGSCAARSPVTLRCVSDASRSRRRAQRRVDQRQQRRARPCLAGPQRKAQAHVLILAFLDEELVPVAARQGLFEAAPAIRLPSCAGCYAIPAGHVLPRPYQALQQRRPRPVRAVVHRRAARGLPASRLRAVVAVRPDLFSRATAPGISMPRSTRPPSAPRPCAPSCSSCASAACSASCGARSPIKSPGHFTAPPPDGDGARGGAVVRRARLRAAHDGLCEAQRRTAHLGAAPLLYDKPTFPGAARQHRRRRPAGGHRPARQSDQGMCRGGRDPAHPRRAGQGGQLHQLPQPVRPAAQARRHDLLRSRAAGGFHTART